MKVSQRMGFNMENYFFKKSERILGFNSFAWGKDHNIICRSCKGKFR